MISEAIIFGAGIVMGTIPAIFAYKSAERMMGSPYVKQLVTAGGELRSQPPKGKSGVVKAISSKPMSFVDEIIDSIEQNPKAWKKYDRGDSLLSGGTWHTGAVNAKADVKILRGIYDGRSQGAKIGDVAINYADYDRIMQALITAQLREKMGKL